MGGKEKEYFRGIGPKMSKEAAVNSVNVLSNFLSRYYHKKVIILLDEYGTPMQEAWLAGYWDEAVSFFRGPDLHLREKMSDRVVYYVVQADVAIL